MSEKPKNPPVKPEQPKATPKKRKITGLPGQQVHSSFKDAMKSIEGTLGEMHVNALKKGN